MPPAISTSGGAHIARFPPSLQYAKLRSIQGPGAAIKPGVIRAHGCSGG